MADIGNETTGPNGPVQAAGKVLENLAELEPELKAAAIIDADGRTLATTGTAENWGGAALELLASLDAVRDLAVDSAHLAGDSAEIFMVREGGISLVAVTGRFVLASLTSFDMRMALRDLAVGGANA